jgi:hypothetical protein
VPVLGEDHMAKFPGERIDQGNDLIAARHAERSTGTKVVLDIDDQQRAIFVRRRGVGRVAGEFRARDRVAGHGFGSDGVQQRRNQAAAVLGVRRIREFFATATIA